MLLQRATILFLFLVCTLPQVQAGTSVTLINSYLADIKQNYNKLIFPKYKTFSKLQVHTSFQLISINGFDEVNGILELVGKLTMSWKDENLANIYLPINYSNLTEILIPESDLWVPPVTIYNSVESLTMIGDSSSYLRVLPSLGWVQWIPGVMTKTGCTVDATYFPYDTQKCEIVITAWGYTNSEIEMTSKDDTIDLSIFGQNEQWVVDGSTVTKKTKSEQSFLTFTITLSRQPNWFLINIVLPVIIVGLLTSLVFLMPIDCGERIGFIITSFLTFAFFLDMIGSSLPHTSDPMAMICYYLTIMLYLSSVSILVTIITMRIYDKPYEEQVPAGLRKVVAVLMCRFCCPKEKTEEGREEKEKKEEREEGKEKPKKEKEVYAPTEAISFRTVGLVLDIAFFVGFMIVNLIISIAFLMPLATQGKK